MRLPLPIPKLAALGAVAACGGIFLLYLLIVWLGLPRPATGGINLAHGAITWISVGCVVVALIALHLALAHQLWHAPVPADAATTPDRSRERSRA